MKGMTRNLMMILLVVLIVLLLLAIGLGFFKNIEGLIPR